ncbi:coiled-coil domain-containing protein 181 [Triplophysa rosa]|uniref:Coiled-coil domain-containing protein 181 n=1 Tax=Triplophysa rosa TaxID=992332 RepID=A0A9W7WG64_TRIRA|nr:coiled-coil domain-containing protein 181 [Triplophysa rosa]XP_057213127.1 coiled-coil domain-containing protein 181 [Triplophysa rosa]XP_057213128.1 coiled-coil domain-containing protein 181 [Triplophysa rosa]KAI7798019.1 coiled-coil domain-containing protein 181 [Triplophysa rosa]
MSVSAVKNGHDEYEDDFEKDLDWLISEESKREEQDPDDYDIEAQIDKELEEEEFKGDLQKEVHKNGDLEEDGEERWPTPMEPIEGVLDPVRDNLVTSPLKNDEELDEEKKYILDKIQEANKQLKDQEAPDQSRHRRLQFKDTLVDLVVPAHEFDTQESDSALCRDLEEEGDVSEQMQKLNISHIEVTESGDSKVEHNGGTKEGRVLVEKDGKFDLVSLKEVESQGLLPPLATFQVENQQASTWQSELSRSPVSSPRQKSTSPFPPGIESLYVPKPPTKRKNRPSSARPSQRGTWVPGTKRRVQSANGASSYSTFTLSPQQKELLAKIQEQRERQAKEEEQKRKEEEEQRRQENEVAFQSWLMRKREQVHEERRVQKAQEMEMMSCKRDCGDPEEAFKIWLQKKQEQQLKEKQLEDMKRLEKESGFCLQSREESEKAFRRWLRRKRAEKRAEQQVARERSRRLVLEERRARRMHDLLCTVNETKLFRFSDPYGYRY